MKAANKVMDIVRLAFHSLKRHPGRSALTALGIIFGVFSVIAMLAINEGASLASQQLLRELGSDNIIINAKKLASQGSKASEGRTRVLFYGLTFADIDRLRTVEGLKRLVIARRTQMDAYVDGKYLTAEVIATEPTYADVARVEVVPPGRFLAWTDLMVLGGKKSCLLTSGFARALFGPHNPLDKEIWLAGDPFTVIGVMDRLPRAMQGGINDPDRCIIIPHTTQESHYSLYTTVIMPGTFKREMAEVNQVIMQMVDEAAVEKAAPVVRRLLEKFHEEPDYTVEVPQELLEQQKAQARLWNITFAFIAAVSLLVGGIGIMNIMLATVTERTREIGIRRALGAKRRDIVVQFLTEAVALTVAGGVLGVALGMLVPRVVETILPSSAGGKPFQAVISITTMLLPFIMAIVVGLVSGLYPARRAAMLDPIEALRHE